MYNRSLLLELFIETDEAIRRIDRRFADINSPEDFISNDNGLDRLDGISMMLISISENIRRIEKIAGTDFLNQYPDIRVHPSFADLRTALIPNPSPLGRREPELKVPRP